MFVFAAIGQILAILVCKLKNAIDVELATLFNFQHVKEEMTLALFEVDQNRGCVGMDVFLLQI